MFLRLGWVVGQAGVILGTLIIVLSNVVTTITAVSMCAICTNGEVAGGGAYVATPRHAAPCKAVWCGAKPGCPMPYTPYQALQISAV